MTTELYDDVDDLLDFPAQDLSDDLDFEVAERRAELDRSDTDREMEALIEFTEQESKRADEAEAKFKAQVQEAEQGSKWYPAPDGELSRIEQAAKVASGMNIAELTRFTESIKAAVEKQRIEDTRGYMTDPSEAPPGPEPFRPNALSKEVFGALTRAEAAGGATINDVPARFNYDNWSEYVNTRLGR